MSRRRAHEAAASGAKTEQTMEHAGLAPRPFYVYRCRCNAFHLTSHYRNRDGERNRRAAS